MNTATRPLNVAGQPKAEGIREWASSNNGRQNSKLRLSGTRNIHFKKFYKDKKRIIDHSLN